MLRGVAVLGILSVNIVFFALPLDANESPYAVGYHHPVDAWVFAAVNTLAAGKFMSLFALLFGAGVALMVDRRRQRGEPAAGLHYGRLATLAVIGLIHGLLIWYGDILLFYAICGAALYPFLRLSGKKLRWVCLGAWVFALLITTGFGLVIAWLVSTAPEGENTARIFENEVELMRGGLLSIMKVRFIHWLIFMLVSPFFFLPWITALMLTGVLAIRGGWMSAERPTRDYRMLLLLGLLVGLPIAVLRTAMYFLEEQMLTDVLSLPLNMIDALALSGAWLALVMLAIHANMFSALRARTAAVGQMALTNYLAQSLICTFLFYGYGLAWFGSFSRTALMGVVVGIWALQLAWSPWWLARHERGPIEAVWRRLTYGSKPRHAPEPASAALSPAGKPQEDDKNPSTHP